MISDGISIRGQRLRGFCANWSRTSCGASSLSAASGSDGSPTVSDAWSITAATEGRVEQSRAAPPQLLPLSIFDAFRPKLTGCALVPPEITLNCACVLSASVGGRPVHPAIALDCKAHFAFCIRSRLACGGYGLAQTELSLSHERRRLLDRWSGYFFAQMRLP
ncbi:hypothetical protein [Caballeronia cordobensis]|uniref:hypothetical protein n=1 Tax=Caballeronia cordobensis TaxID=1353886 RepID=UPI0006AD7458|nr:hypothetical protein [Caballeronia cordobensis]